MSGELGRLRVALVDHGYESRAHDVCQLALGLAAVGHAVEVLAAGRRSRRGEEDGVTVVRRRQLPDAPLRLRKIGDRPGRLPATYLALCAGGYDLAHAFTPQDAVAALLWARRGGRQVVFSCREPLGRASLADRRLRLAMLRRAVEGTDAVVAPSPAVSASLARWMAVDARMIEPGDIERHVRLYQEVRGLALHEHG